MSAKAAFTGLFKKGKQVLQTVLKTKTQKAPVKVGAVLAKQQQIVRCWQALPKQDKFHSLFRNVIPKVYYNSLARELSRRAALRGTGRNVPLLAFMGLVLANAKDKGEDEITTRIQNFIKASVTTDSPVLQRVQSLSLDQFQFGQRIGQGCNAAVYEARFKSEEQVDVSSVTDDDSMSDITVLTEADDESDTEMAEAEETSPVVPATIDTISEDGSDISVLTDHEDHTNDNFVNLTGEFQHNTNESLEISGQLQHFEIVEVLPDNTSEAGSDFSLLGCSGDELDKNERAPLVFFVRTPDTRSEADSDIEVLSDSEAGVDDGGGMQRSTEMSGSRASVADWLMTIQLEADPVPPDIVEDEVGSLEGYNSLDSSVSYGFNLAVKMMFNYDAESNAHAILRQMDRETVPARILPSEQQANFNGTSVRKKSVPPHPNIVEMWGVFVDPVPQLPDGLLHYPAALPSRINPAGVGRNMTLFLVMNKYSMTLEEYLSVVPKISVRERLVLLTQLLEAVAHLRHHGVAHRDIKADNILLDIDSDGPPRLVLTDFGCCLADSQHGLQLPFTTDEIDRGGNTALMAPEIACAVPGRFSTLDYRKADLWSVGALAFQILGADNPFYGQASRNRLDSRSYRESELPALPDCVPAYIHQLVQSLLCREPSQRPSARQAADFIHLYLWSPSNWLYPGNCLQRSEVEWWLVNMAAEVMLKKGAHSNTNSILKRSFLENFNMNRLKECFTTMAVQGM